jgi:gliding motility-associated-like protein
MYIYPTPPEPILSATSPICPGDPITFSADAIPNSIINWSGPNNLVSTDFSFSIPIYEDQMGYYTAYITSEFGCVSDTANVFASILNIYGFDDFDFPNVLTPNGDGLNDVLDVESYFQTCQEFTLYIFNRVGNLVYEQSNGEPVFEGKYQNTDDMMDGVYIYKLVYEKGEKNGFIHLIR